MFTLFNEQLAPTPHAHPIPALCAVLDRPVCPVGSGSASSIPVDGADEPSALTDSAPVRVDSRGMAPMTLEIP